MLPSSFCNSHILPLYLLQIFRRGLFGQKQGPAFPRLQAPHVQQVPHITMLLTVQLTGVSRVSCHHYSATKLMTSYLRFLPHCFCPPSSVCRSANPVMKEMWPDGQLSITEVTKRPLTAATLFKNSIVALVDKLGCKVSDFSLRLTFCSVSPSREAVVGLPYLD